jgi:pimeloyl-ACP methyl ester carboxylesterase
LKQLKLHGGLLGAGAGPVPVLYPGYERPPQIRHLAATQFRGLPARPAPHRRRRGDPAVRPVLLIWGEARDFFPLADARRLASDFPRATLVPVLGAKTWVPVDSPAAVAGAIAEFVPAPVR